MFRRLIATCFHVLCLIAFVFGLPVGAKAAGAEHRLVPGSYALDGRCPYDAETGEVGFVFDGAQTISGTLICDVSQNQPMVSVDQELFERNFLTGDIYLEGLCWDTASGQKMRMSQILDVDTSNPNRIKPRLTAVNDEVVAYGGEEWYERCDDWDRAS